MMVAVGAICLDLKNNRKIEWTCSCIEKRRRRRILGMKSNIKNLKPNHNKFEILL